MSKEKTLSLDCSTKRTGWAFLDEDNKLHYGAILCSDSHPEKRIAVMKEKILEIVKNENITHIVMEDVIPGGKTNAHTTKLLTWLQGNIVVEIFGYNKNIDFDFLIPTVWRADLGLQKPGVKREAQKLKDIEFANKEYNLDLTSSMDDEADAICILTAYNRKNRSVF